MRGRIENDLSIYNWCEINIHEFPLFARKWYWDLKANEVTAMSCKQYLTTLKKFLTYVNTNIKIIKPTDLTEDIIINYFIESKFVTKKVNGQFIKMESSDSYKQGIWSCLNNFFDYLESQGIIEKNYIKALKIKRPKNRDLDRINRDRILLTKDDFKKIINAIENGVGSSGSQKYQYKYRNRDMSIMLLFMTTGMRKTALREINIDDIDLNNKKIVVVDKGHKIHEYSLADNVIEYLNNWLLDRRLYLGVHKTDALFISRNLTRISGQSISELIDKYAYAALGYHISPHKLRSGLSSILYKETHDLEYVRRVIGHANITTTQRYVVTDNKEREKAANYISGFLN